MEDHRDAALDRGDIVDPLTIDRKLAIGDVLEPGDEAQERGLAAPRWADENRELAVLDREIDALDDIDLAEGLADSLEYDVDHAAPFSP